MRFHITVRHDGNDDIQRVLVGWAEGQVQAISDALMEEVGDDFEFEMTVGQEGPATVPETVHE